MSGSTPVRIPASSTSHSPPDGSPVDQSLPRIASSARLASPVPSAAARRQSNASYRQAHARSASGRVSGAQTPLPCLSVGNASGPRESALSSALAASFGQNPASTQTLPDQVNSDGPSPSFLERPITQQNYGSFASSSMQDISGRQSPIPYEDFDVVRRHLVVPRKPPASNEAARRPSAPRYTAPEGNEGNSRGFDEFSSLRLQGGDITREIYRRTEAEQNARRQKHQRSQSFNVFRPPPPSEQLDITNIRQPGGFRRHHLMRNAPSPAPSAIAGNASMTQHADQQPNFLARTFYEFLSLYGHFAGEELEDEDEEDLQTPDSEWLATHPEAEYDYAAEEPEGAAERRPLLRRATSTYRRRKEDEGPKKGAAGTIFILLKSFVGTGVLFLPRAFLNGGILFSFIVLFLVALVSYYCFLLLTTSRLVLKASFAEMGELVYGKWMRLLINISLVISQMGFASAYIVFTAENLRAFVLAVSKCRTNIDIKLMILMQLIIFLPLSLYRNLNNIAFVVYIADVFIVLGLVYLYYYGIATLASNGISDVALFNPNGWTLFIGTAIFTFEGIGLLIPIQDGMKKPQQLPAVLGFVMVIISVIFISMGALSYAAYGSKTETVIILNMPQDDKFVNAVQFLYSLAILLSTPLQIFPAITIMEKGIFTKSGKYSPNVKWLKNGFRCAVVLGSALIAWVGANDLDKFVALVGSFACIPLVYMYPPLIHRKAVAGSWWSGALDLLLFTFGIILMAYTSTLTIWSWIEGASEAPAKGYCDA